MAQFVDAGHNALVANAPQVWFQGGPKPAAAPRPMSQPAIGVQHLSGESPPVWVGRTPPFVPPPPRNLGYVAIGERQEPGTAPFAMTRGTPPFVPANARNNGYVAIGVQHPDGNNIPPWSFTNSVVPQIQQSPSSRGSRVVASSGVESDWNTPPVFTRSTVGIPTPQVLGTPAFRASFVKANGWWDVLSEAPFFFALGMATQPPGPPPMRALGEQLPSGDAPYTFTFSFRPPSVGFPLPGVAAGLQQSADAAPFSFTVSTRLPNQAGPPITQRAFGLQQSADAAPFSWVVGRAKISAVPPVKGVFADAKPADIAPYVWTFSASPNVLTFQPTFQTFGLQQPFDSAPFSFTSRFIPGIHGALPIPPTVTQWAFPAIQIEHPASFVFARGLPLGSTIPAVTAEILSAAIFRIVNANLLVSVPFLYQSSNAIPPGYVIGTIPDTGTMLQIWTPVQIIVSTGPSFLAGFTGVPDVIGETAQDARDALFAAGLSLDSYAWQVSIATAGTVTAQFPSSTGPVVPIGTIVKLTLSLGPPNPPLPTPPIPPPELS